MFCAKVKEFLSQKQIQYDDHDITKEPAAIAELQKLGFLTTPVTVIGHRVIVGFDQVKLEGALGSRE
jgi:glutaredoxin-like protein NrdH